MVVQLVLLVLLVHRDLLELLVRLVSPDRLVLLVHLAPRVSLDLLASLVSVVNKVLRVLLDLREYQEIANLVLRALLDSQGSRDSRVFKVPPEELDSARLVFLVK